jgi:transposase-like protein
MRLYAIFYGLRPRRTLILFVSRCPGNPHATWRPDQVYLKIDGRVVYFWRAVDAEGEVLDVLVQSN